MEKQTEKKEMQINEFLELVRNRRCIHKFRPDPIPDEFVEKIIEAARWAMSGGNGQPWEFIVVKDQETKNKIAELYVESRKGQYPIEKTRLEEFRHGLADADPLGAPGFKVAPVLIIVLGDTRTLQASVLSINFITVEGAPGSIYLKNMANATQNLHLAARALGLSSQWASVNHILEQSLKPLLHVPPQLNIHTIVPIGYPANEPPRTYRRELKEIIHYEQYDQSKFRSDTAITEWLRDLRKRMEATG